MSHVDDGALHAYLDGALDALPGPEAERIREHLAACDACARRLEEERAVRAEARSILDGASPALDDLPSLEELRALAAAGRGSSVGARLRHLGFAASLVLAVGAGWLLRGSQAPRFEGGPLDDVLLPAATEAPPEARQEAPAAGFAEEAVAEAVEEPTAPARDRSGVGAAVTPAVPTPETVRPAAAEAEADAVAEAPEARNAAGDAERAGGLGALQDSLLRRLQVSAVSAEAKSAEVAPAATLQRLPRRRADVTLADPGVGVPGLPYLSVAWAPEGLPEGSLRVLQLVGSDTLEVLHLPADAGVSVPWPSVFSPRNQAVMRRGDVWLLGRAVLPREEIEALLARIPPEER